MMLSCSPQQISISKVRQSGQISASTGVHPHQSVCIFLFSKTNYLHERVKSAYLNAEINMLDPLSLHFMSS